MAEIRLSHFGYRVVIRMTEMPCRTPQDVLRSPLVAQVVQRFLEHLVKHDSPLLSAIQGLDGALIEKADAVVGLLRLLVDNRPHIICTLVPKLAPALASPQLFGDFVDKLYDFWRDYERYLIYESTADESRDRAIEGHIPFVRANDNLKNLVLEAYRYIDSNLRGFWPRVYHQVPAGANIGLLVDHITWPCPDGPYATLAGIPFVRLALLELPVVLYPRRTTCLGQCVPVQENPLDGVMLEPREWYCLPLKVGPLIIHTFFHEEYLGLASSLVNLFEVAGHAEARQAPHGILVFGVPPAQLGDERTVFFEDNERDLVLGMVGRSEEVDYFGYFQQMIFTLHNVIMLRRGCLPVHGAMCHIELQDRSSANIVIIDDTGAGRSETLEALRVYAHDHLRAMTIVFDGIGSLEMQPDGSIMGYGTETGAFVRLDDLQPGYAFGQFDRSIFMNPHKADAQVVMPMTTYDAVMAGYRVDMVLYANNDTPVDAVKELIEYFPNTTAALSVFANPSAQQLAVRHDPLAARFLAAMFDTGVKVGELRTRQGIPEDTQISPETVAAALFAQVAKLARSEVSES
ncbi:MAG: phosphoenolpyruvate carboxykinase [Armatimonadota bacterium]